MPNMRGANPVGRGDGVCRSYVAKRTAEAGRHEMLEVIFDAEETIRRESINQTKECSSV